METEISTIVIHPYQLLFVAIGAAMIGRAMGAMGVPPFLVPLIVGIPTFLLLYGIYGYFA